MIIESSIVVMHEPYALRVHMRTQRVECRAAFVQDVDVGLGDEMRHEYPENRGPRDNI